jgi:glycyl-tRNA synthetase
MDAIGIPFCMTVNQQTKEDDTVTIRYWNSMLQDRIPAHKVSEMLQNAISLSFKISFG